MLRGVNELYLTDNKNGELLSKLNWFVFEPEEEKIDFDDKGYDKLFNTSLRGYTVGIEANLDKNNIYEVYIYPTEYHKVNKQVFDLYINGELADTVNMEENEFEWDRKGPYLTKVLDDGKLSIECRAIQGIASVGAIEINKISYTKEFDDVKIKDWSYIPIMELASQGSYFLVKEMINSALGIILLVNTWHT